MAETYSLGITGAAADNAQAVRPGLTLNEIDIPDSAARPGSREAAMRLGTPILCQNPDGSQSLYKYDAERNVPGIINVLQKVT